MNNRFLVRNLEHSLTLRRGSRDGGGGYRGSFGERVYGSWRVFREVGDGLVELEMVCES